MSRPTRPAPRPTRPAPRPLRPAPRPTPPRDAPTLEQIGVSPVAARGQAATVLDSALYGGGSSTPAPTQDAESVEGELPGSGARPRSTRRPARPPQWELFAPGDRSRSETATPATARAAPVPPPGDGIRWQTFDDATEEGELP